MTKRYRNPAAIMAENAVKAAMGLIVLPVLILSAETL
jgi:hypothetical protein